MYATAPNGSTVARSALTFNSQKLQRLQISLQVDGKIERILPVAAFYYLNSIPDESMTSREFTTQLLGDVE